MRIQYRGKDAASEAVLRIIERQADLLDERLPQADDDLKALTVTTEHHHRDDSYSATLLLRVPGHQIVSVGHGPRDDTALRDAFSDLTDQLGRYLVRLRGERAKRREGKFHRDKATLMAELTEAAHGWPPEPPRTPDEAAAWGKIGPKVRR